MVLARMSFWNFKIGKREGAFAELDRILNTLSQDAEGFRVYMSLLSYMDPNALTVLTLWQDEESMKKSEKGVFAQAVKKSKTPLNELLESKITEYIQHSYFSAHNKTAR